MSAWSIVFYTQKHIHKYPNEPFLLVIEINCHFFYFIEILIKAIILTNFL